MDNMCTHLHESILCLHVCALLECACWYAAVSAACTQQVLTSGRDLQSDMYEDTNK